MKLVIDISEGKWKSVQDGTWCGSEEILTATPLEKVLEDIKGEIEELIDWHDCPIEYDNGNDAWYREACNRAISIIDSHISGKEKE